MNILITGAWQQGKEYVTEIEKLGHKVQFLQYEKDDLPCEYEWIEGLICNGIFLHHKIEKFINLKYIQLTSAGFDRVPMDYVNKQNIKIYNARGVYSIPMAEYSVAGVLSLYKSMNFFCENQKKNIWEKKRNLFELNNKTVTILGCGNVGSECAKRFKAFGCKVLGLDIFINDNPYFTIPCSEIMECDSIPNFPHTASGGIKGGDSISNFPVQNTIFHISKINDILPISDIVILTMPLTNETYHLFNEEKFKLLKPNCILVNISRGAVIDQRALENNLDNIGGAVLDVFEEEPLNENSSLWENNNVIITPHNSFISEGNNKRLKDVVISNLNSNI